MDSDEGGLHPGWHTLILVVVFAVLIWLTYSLFAGTLRSKVPVTLTSDRAGLVMEPNAKVKFRGVQVGRVSSISLDHGPGGPAKVWAIDIHFVATGPWYASRVSSG